MYSWVCFPHRTVWDLMPKPPLPATGKYLLCLRCWVTNWVNKDMGCEPYSVCLQCSKYPHVSQLLWFLFLNSEPSPTPPGVQEFLTDLQWLQIVLSVSLRAGRLLLALAVLSFIRNCPSENRQVCQRTPCTSSVATLVAAWLLQELVVLVEIA